MTPAELDTRRRSLGLSIEEQARVCGPVHEKTVRRWHSGAAPIPDDVRSRLDDIEDQMDRSVEALVRMYTDFVDAGPVRLTRYRTQDDLDESPHAGLPLGAHAMMTAWVDAALAKEGVDTVIEWAD